MPTAAAQQKASGLDQLGTGHPARVVADQKRKYPTLPHPYSSSAVAAGIFPVPSRRRLGALLAEAASELLGCDCWPGFTQPRRSAADRFSRWRWQPMSPYLPFARSVGNGFEICSAFTHVAACTLAQSPYFVTAIWGLQTCRRLHAPVAWPARQGCPTQGSVVMWAAAS